MSEQKQLEKMPTGIPGLDHLLQGGIVRGNSMLVEGPPGSGKTTVAIRIAYEGVVQYDEPALLISFEEFPRQIYQESLSYGVDLETLEKAGKMRVIWTPPARILEGFTGKNDLVDKIISELGVRRVVIDSITHFKRVSVAEMELREILGEILNYLKMRGINSFLIKELERLDDQTIAFEEYLVDASMRIHNSPSTAGGENTRLLELRKTRGQGHISGRHPFRMSDKGLIVYPRLRPRDVTPVETGVESDSTTARAEVGVEGLDGMLYGGFLNTSLNIVAGFPGSGKTVIGSHFFDHGLEAGEKCLMISTQHSAREVINQAHSLGMDWQDHLQNERLEILHFHPVGLCIEEMLNLLLERLRTFCPERFVFDSIDGLWSAEKDEDRIQDHILLLMTMLKNSGATSIILSECSDMGGKGGRMQDYANLAACVIQLSMAESNGELRRFVGISKHVDSDHAKELRELTIDSSGMSIERKATGLSGILSGQTSGALDEVADRVMPSVEELNEIIRTLSACDEDSGDARKLIKKAAMKLNLLDVLLREYFGMTEFHKVVDELVEL